MEFINTGEVPLETVIHHLFDGGGLHKLIGRHGAACFVLVRSGLAPEFYEKLVRNVWMIDATTRHHIAFIVFHGRKRVVTYRGTDRMYGYDLADFSFYGEVSTQAGDDSLDLQFDQEFGHHVRDWSTAAPVKRIVCAMDVATTLVLERFGILEQALPCLLFLDSSSMCDSQLVQLSSDSVLESLYQDVLAPLSDEFRILESFWRHRNAVSTLERFPAELKALEKKLEHARSELKNRVAAHSTKQSELMQKCDELKASHEAYKNATFDDRVKMISRDSRYFDQAHDLKQRLTDFEKQKRFAYSEPLTEEKRQIIGRLGGSVNQLRKELSAVLRMYAAEVQDRLQLVTTDIDSDPTVERLRRNLLAAEREVGSLHENRARAERTIAEFANVDSPLEQNGKAKMSNRLQELGYAGNFLKEENPRAIDVVRTMATHGRIGSSRPSRQPPKEKVKILFLAANPRETRWLDLEEERRSLEIELRGTQYRDEIAFVAKEAVRPDDLVRLVRAESPHVVHFSGHGSLEGILLRDEGSDNYRIVSGESLSRMLKGRGVKMIVLNACFSMELARALSSAVDTVIGTVKAVGDEAARRFSVAFYRTIGNGYTIGEAIRDGGDAIALHNLEDVYKVIGKTSGRLVGARTSL